MKVRKTKNKSFLAWLDVAVRLERTRRFSTKRRSYKANKLYIYKDILNYKRVAKIWEEECNEGVQ